MGGKFYVKRRWKQAEKYKVRMKEDQTQIKYRAMKHAQEYRSRSLMERGERKLG